MHEQQTWRFLPRVVCETGYGAESDDCFRMRRDRTQTFAMDFIPDESWLASWPGRSKDNGCGKQRIQEMQPKSQPNGFITDMSNGDDSGATVSRRCQIFF